MAVPCTAGVDAVAVHIGWQQLRVLVGLNIELVVRDIEQRGLVRHTSEFSQILFYFFSFSLHLHRPSRGEQTVHSGV